MANNLYMTGYNGTTRDRASLLSWSHWQNMDPELARRVLALLDASIAAGRPLGIGSIFRTYEQQLSLFLSRYHVSAFGTTTWDGKRWAKNAGVAAAAPPGRSYHEATTGDNKALAIDFTGDLAWLKLNCARFGLLEFSQVNSEPWHGQPTDVPKGRSSYVLLAHHPLKQLALPGIPPKPSPLKVWAPAPTQKQRTGLFAGKNDPVQVKALQLQCNFWGWRDVTNKQLLVDGDFGSKTAQAVMSMQRALGFTGSWIDGQYGPATATRLQKHLDGMAAWVSQ